MELLFLVDRFFDDVDVREKFLTNWIEYKGKQYKNLGNSRKLKLKQEYHEKGYRERKL